jgi:hypothetical protein
MALQASSDQSELTNEHVAQQETGEPLCPIYDSACAQVGTAPRSQAQAAATSSGCSTSPPRDARGTFALLLAVAGVTAVRLRERRRARRVYR